MQSFGIKGVFLALKAVFNAVFLILCFFTVHFTPLCVTIFTEMLTIVNRSILMNIAIIDDSATDRTLLSNYLMRYMADKQIPGSITITEFESGEDFFASYSFNSFHIVFIDCYMYGMSGMDVAKKLRNQKDTCAIFFTTSSPEYAVESFLVKASGYLLKPYKYGIFCQSLDLCDTIKLLISNPYVDYPDGKSILRFYISDIICCNTDGHYIEVVCKTKGNIRFRSSFDAFSTPLLEYPQFLISCRGHLINMDYVKNIEDCDFIMEDDTHVPITKKLKTEIKGSYERYLLSKVAQK